MHIEIHAANIHDTISGCKVVEETLKKYQDLQIISGDMGYRGTCFKYVTDILKKTMKLSPAINFHKKYYNNFKLYLKLKV